MTPKATIAGMGIASSLGHGVSLNASRIVDEKERYATRTLTDSPEAINVPFLEALDYCAPSTTRPAYLIDSAVEEALSKVNLSESDRKTMPIFIGSSSYYIGEGETLYRTALSKNDDAVALPLNGFDQIGRHLRDKHRLSGADYAFNTACTASANAILSAANCIALGHHDYALVIGVETLNETTLSGFHGMQLLSDSIMRPFDKRRNGLIIGEGCAALLLTRATPGRDAMAFIGGASRCDTYSISASNPDGSSIANVMLEALRQSELSPKDIVAVKAHGTASPLNDDAEAAGMRLVFDPVPDFIALKPYVGHTLGSCGAIETVLLAGCLEMGILPRSGGFSEVDHGLDVTPNTETVTAQPGYYMLNFFGFGGNNCSLVTHWSGVR